MNEWKPIETAPKDGARILCYWPRYEYDWCEDPNEGSEEILIAWWVVNGRIVSAHKDGRWPKVTEGYFHDTCESDDYGLAMAGHGPTHWMPLPVPPK
jgi:Protein of unknown function (DUF551)